MEPKVENIKAAFEAADENGKKMLRALYPDVFNQPVDNRSVTERIKTFEDACNALGEAHPLVLHYALYEQEMNGNYVDMGDITAYLKLRIVVAALNEGWTPDWGNKDERKWFPWFYILSEEEYNDLDEEGKSRVVGRAGYSAQANGGLVCSYADYVSSSSLASLGARLAFKSKELAIYCGKQFGELWASFQIN